MGAFNTAVVTAKGQALLTKAIAGTCKVVFTKMALSDAHLTGDLSALSELRQIKQAEPVSQVSIKDNATVSCEVVFTNKDLQTGYDIRAIGLYATDPDEGEILYSISTADESVGTADWMPSSSVSGITSYAVNVVTTVANASSVEVTVDPSSLVTMAQFKGHGHEEAGYYTRKIPLTDITTTPQPSVVLITDNTVSFTTGTSSCYIEDQGDADITITALSGNLTNNTDLAIILNYQRVQHSLVTEPFHWTGKLKQLEIRPLNTSTTVVLAIDFISIKAVSGFMTGMQAELLGRMDAGTGENSIQQVLDTESWNTTNEKVKEYVKGTEENGWKPIAGANNGLTIKGSVVGDVVKILVGAFGKLSTMMNGKSQTIGSKSHAEGSKCIALENNSHAEGNETFSAGAHSHAEGNGTSAIGNSAHAEGGATLAEGKNSHAEGNNTEALADNSHAEGHDTTASGENSHAEGVNTQSIGANSHSEGYETEAKGFGSHAEGGRTKALGAYNHVEGFETVAQGDYQSVHGRANIVDDEYKYLFIIGNGKLNDDYSVAERSNAHTVDWDGNAWYAGSVEATRCILRSPSGKRFMISADDSGNITATEV